MSISDYFEKELLKTLKGEAPTLPAKVFVKLHIGDPGEAGTANPAKETKRKQATFTGENPLKNSAAVEWAGVSDTEEYTHVSLWDKEGAAEGNCLWSGALTAKKAMTAGDNFVLAKEALEVTLD